MEPLHPAIRTALKEAHPTLTDKDIDWYEELLARRVACDPEESKEEIRQLDREREQLLKEKMPEYKEVYQRVVQLLDASKRGNKRDRSAL